MSTCLTKPTLLIFLANLLLLSWNPLRFWRWFLKMYYKIQEPKIFHWLLTWRLSNIDQWTIESMTLSHLAGLDYMHHDCPIDVGLHPQTLRAFTTTDLVHQGRLHFAIVLLSFVLDQQQKINMNSILKFENENYSPKSPVMTSCVVDDVMKHVCLDLIWASQYSRPTLTVA